MAKEMVTTDEVITGRDVRAVQDFANHMKTILSRIELYDVEDLPFEHRLQIYELSVRSENMATWLQDKMGIEPASEEEEGKKFDIEKLKSVIKGILLADHMGDVAREIPDLFELAGVDIKEIYSLEEALERWARIEPEQFGRSEY